MKKLFSIVFLGIAALSTSVAQSDKTIIFAGTDALRGVGQTTLDLGAGVNARFHYPIVPNLALTAKLGAEYFKMSGYGYGFNSAGLAYGYSPVTGWGFNRVEPRLGITYYETTGVVLPVVVGVRYYLTALAKGLHIDVNLGRDFAVTETMVGTLRVEPGIGYTLTLGNGQFIDFSALSISGLKPGTNIVGLSVAYGFPVKF